MSVQRVHSIANFTAIAFGVASAIAGILLFA